MEKLLDSTEFAHCTIQATLGILNQKRPGDILASFGTCPTLKLLGQEAVVMLNSGHADGIMAHQDVLEQEGSRKEGKEVHNSTDYHYMLSVIFESLVQPRRTPIDFNYKGKAYKDIQVSSCSHVKADNEEADKLCAKYGSRSGNVIIFAGSVTVQRSSPRGHCEVSAENTN
jgi:hypothetical protein